MSPIAEPARDLLRSCSFRCGRILLVFLLALLAPAFLFAQTPPTTIRQYTRTNEHRILKEFVQLLSIPNLASNHDDIRRNADFIMEMMKRRGLTPRLLEGADQSTPPAVYA